MGDGLHLIARIAGERVALRALAIESVVEIDAVTPVPLAPPHIAGLAALRSRVMTVVDSYAAIGLAPPPGAGAQAAVATVDGHLYGLLVDEVEDIVESGPLMPLQPGIAAGWAAVATGLVEHDGAAILLCDPARIVAPQPPTIR